VTTASAATTTGVVTTVGDQLGLGVRVRLEAAHDPVVRLLLRQALDAGEKFTRQSADLVGESGRKQ